MCCSKGYFVESVTADNNFLTPINDMSAEAPAGKKLAVVHYDSQTETWMELTTEVKDGYADAHSNLTGTFALMLVGVK